MLKAISRRAQSVSPDASQGQGLRVVPILGPSHAAPAYEVLRPQTINAVKVTEIDAAGSVPTLRVENTLELPVFLMDGQELVGAKQNRVLNTDVMVPAKRTVLIPVSCVEQGRWRRQSACFMPGKSASHRSRHAKAQRVHRSLKEKKGHDADQGAIWHEVEQTLSRCLIASPTSALADAYAAHEKQLTRFRSALRLPDAAVGLAALHRGRVQGIDLFDRHSTLRHFWDLLLDSYGIDLLGEAVDVTQPDESAEASLIRAALDRAAAGRWEPFASPGEGTDWRLEDEQFAGAALVWGGAGGAGGSIAGGNDAGRNDAGDAGEVVVHLQLFPTIGTQG